MLSPDEVYQICWKSTQCYPWRVNQLGGRYVNGKPLPKDIRMQILQFARIGVRPCDISRQMKITHGCISKLLAKYNKTGSMEPGSIRLERPGLLRPEKERRSGKITGVRSERLPSRPRGLDYFPPLLNCAVNPQHPERNVTDDRCRSLNPKTKNLIDKRSTHVQDERSDATRPISRPYKHSIDEILNNKRIGEKKTVTAAPSTIAESARQEPGNKPLPKKKDAPPVLRKQSQRSHFSRQQIQILQEEFMRNQYPGIHEREQLSRDLDVSETRIRVWFSNRRAKNRQTSRKIQECTAKQMERSYICCQRFQHNMPDIPPGLILDPPCNKTNSFVLETPQETYP